jgi:ABC-type transport system involved in Fe-S cluster assembly fused permease/ATPase subunit
MENGTIIESGTHNGLVKKDGKYAYMWNVQAEQYD